jgi:hypothetical protein
MSIKNIGQLKSFKLQNSNQINISKELNTKLYSGIDVEKIIKDVKNFNKHSFGKIETSKIIENIIKETINSKGNITSHYKCSSTEALEIGIKFLGHKYRQIGNGVFRSKSNLRQFRIDPGSISGKHFPHKSHFHLEILDEKTKKFLVNNHIILED